MNTVFIYIAGAILLGALALGMALASDGSNVADNATRSTIGSVENPVSVYEFYWLDDDLYQYTSTYAGEEAPARVDNVYVNGVRSHCTQGCTWSFEWAHLSRAASIPDGFMSALHSLVADAIIAVERGDHNAGWAALQEVDQDKYLDQFQLRQLMLAFYTGVPHFTGP